MIIVPICIHYTTTGYPTFKPRCKLGKWAGLKCHDVNKDCVGYKPSKEE